MKVSVDQNQQLAKAYRVHSWPTLLFKHGAPVERHPGLASRETLEGLVVQ